MNPILVVVGGAEPRQRLVRILFRAGYKVYEAETGKTALEIAHATSPALILIAIVMPDVNGLEIAADLRHNVGAASTPIILLGATRPIGIEDEPLSSLVSGYLNMDVSSHDLLRAVHSQINS